MDVARILTLALLSLLVAAPVAEAAKRTVPQGFYGVMWDRGAQYAPEEAQQAQWSLMSRSGVESVRTVFSWAAAQPSEGGPFDFAVTDRVVARAARNGSRLLPVVLDAPAWASAFKSENGSPPTRNEDYTAYLSALVGRYGPAGSFWSENPDVPRRPVREWQIWNEPHIDHFWYANGETPDVWAPDYVRLLRASHAAVKRADPGARVVLAGLADYAWRHLGSIYAAGGRRYFDVAAINFFSATPAKVLKGLRFFRSALRKGGDPRKAMYLTEVTWPASKGREPIRARWQLPWQTTDRGMARRVTQVYDLLARHRRGLRLGRVYWYTWASAYRRESNFEWGGLVRFSGGPFEPRPALRAYRLSARKHQGCAKTSAGRCR